MGRALFAWIGMADLRASRNEDAGGLGPIGQAVRTERYDQVVLLCDHDPKTTKAYVKWLQGLSDAQVEVHAASLTSPTAFGEIYEENVEALESYRKRRGATQELAFHLSPGTPAMAAVWIILAKTRYPATLLESSREHGVRVASVPFDLSADYLPDLLRKPDDDLLRFSQGLPAEAPEFEDIVHRCAAMKRLIAMARRVAPRSISVLILGESGTGKELLARAIHRSSAVRTGPFVPVNCGAIPRDLVESELFGHEKGAFTGAQSARVGYIEAASGGTLFLDEVGELPHAAQVKLLRVLQERQVTRVGATKPREVTFRLIAATNRNLPDEVAEGRFREDLFHRIAVAILQAPALREREGDIGLLVDTLLGQINREAQSQPGYEEKRLSAAARSLLLRQPWRGNIRELANTLQRAAVWTVGGVINVRDIEESLLPTPNKARENVLGRSLGHGFDLQKTIAEVAQHYLSLAMEQAAGNKTKAAELLGLPSYQTLTNWLKRYAEG
ncbi:MAG: sigma-54-dependent Fis family transcriptional regulator [Candidatus Hydrogenedentes bacterium]|nr:sigma-54-dependent Fis family transcriptional regulator [Candidatus Hydrogenedentota bacterium]